MCVCKSEITSRTKWSSQVVCTQHINRSWLITLALQLFNPAPCWETLRRLKEWNMSIIQNEAVLWLHCSAVHWGWSQMWWWCLSFDYRLLSNEKCEVSKGKTTLSSIGAVPSFPKSEKKHHAPTHCWRHLLFQSYTFMYSPDMTIVLILTQNMIFSSAKPKVLIPEPHQADGRSHFTVFEAKGTILRNSVFPEQQAVEQMDFWLISLTTEMSE